MLNCNSLNKILLILLSIGWHSNAMGKKLVVSVEALPEGEWEKAELAMIEEATQIVFDRIASYKVAQCAYRQSFRVNKDQLRNKWGRQIPILNKMDKVNIIIRKQSMRREALGSAIVGKASVDRKNYRMENLDINLNKDRVREFVQNRWQKTNSVHSNKNKASLDKWVNVIAHELAHNYGYSHGTSGQYDNDYPGWFPTELGFCVMTNGKYGSSLGDRKLRIKRQNKYR
ncbi:MAG: hypothetical protein CMP10_07100 [Zetaproteobacteria bacterium]|nr:hypothetical protein [Pseudobdellovibrionaceae bacterium]|tara:strand:- start:945 stop:1631 length:687 start_codon:yes stop_codon:yes gene_type:complete